MKPDWTTFTRRIFINAPIERIYRAWTCQNEMESWFLRKAVFTSPTGERRDPNEPFLEGDQFHWEWHNWEGFEKGDILHANGTDRLTFTFADGKVDISIERVDGVTLLSLTQSGIAEDEENKYKIFFGCSNGWTFWMTNLKSYLEHGITLHNQKEGSLLKWDGFEMINN